MNEVLINQREIINQQITLVLSDLKKINGLVDLMEIYEDDRFIEIISKSQDKKKLEYSEILKLLSCGLGLIFVKYIPIYYKLNKTKKNTTNNQVYIWFTNLYKDYRKRLLFYIRNFSDDYFITTYFNLAKVEISQNINLDEIYNIMIRFIKSYIQNKNITNINKFEKDYLKYNDIKWLILKSIIIIYTKNIKEFEKNKDYKNIYEKTFLLLKCCSSIVIDENNIESLKLQTNFFNCEKIQLKNTQKIFSNAWLKFLQINIPFEILISVYECLHIMVIPYLLNPRLFADFLLQSMDQGNLLGLLSLNSLFILMTKHNFECESFYKKLYNLLPIAIKFDEIFKNNKKLNLWWNFDSNYESGKYHFWNILQLSLTSTHIPAYMTASFCKRLARFALISLSITDTILCLITIGSILSYHDGIRFLMFRKSKNNFVNDPFDMNQENIEVTNAMESSLWELISLKNHYCSEVVETVDSLCENTENAWNWRKTHFKIPRPLANINYSNFIQQMIFQTCKIKEESEKIPVNADLPKHLKLDY